MASNHIEEYKPKVWFTKFHGDRWECIIESGPGHHGIGRTMADAMMQAAMAWKAYEPPKPAPRPEIWPNAR